MTYLDKKTAIFQRNEEGNLIPEEITLELLEDKPTIQLIPMTRGKIKELFGNLKSNGDTTKDQDNDIILKYCVNPTFSEQEVKDLKPKVANAIVMAILSESLGMTQEELSKDTTKKAIEMQEENLKK